MLRSPLKLLSTHASSILANGKKAAWAAFLFSFSIALAFGGKSCSSCAGASKVHHFVGSESDGDRFFLASCLGTILLTFWREASE